MKSVWLIVSMLSGGPLPIGDGLKFDSEAACLLYAQVSYSERVRRIYRLDCLHIYVEVSDARGPDGSDDSGR